MNLELQRQHEAHKARQVRLHGAAPVCRAIPAPVIRFLPKPRAISQVDWRWPPTGFDEHVRAWRRRNAPLWKAIIRAVSETTCIDVADMLGKGRTRPVAQARQIAMLLLFDDAGLSLPDIGRRLGGKDHTTVLHGVRKMRMRLGVDEDLSANVACARGIFADRLRAKRETRA